MWAGGTGNTEEQLAGSGMDHHNPNSQEEVKGGLRISRNKKLRRREKETQGIVMVMWFWLKHIGAVYR